MFDINNIDLKIILAFTNAYENLYEKGEITEEQLDSVLSLIDNMKKYSREEFKKELNRIFPQEETAP